MTRKTRKPKPRSAVTVSGMDAEVRAQAQAVADRLYRGNLSAYICVAIEHDIQRLRDCEEGAR